MICLFNVLAILLLFRSTASQPLPFQEYAQRVANIDTRAVSERCAAQMTLYGDGLVNNQSWAWNLFDASPKIPYGILTGNLIEAGNYDQCLTVEYNGLSEQVLGKFCLYSYLIPIPLYLVIDDVAETRIRSQQHQIGLDTSFSLRSGLPMRPEEGYRVLSVSVCLPDACLPSEALESLYLSQLGLPIIVNDDAECQTINDRGVLNGGDIAFIVFIAVILFLSVISTFYDEVLRGTGPGNPWFYAFSLTRNLKKIGEKSSDPKRIACLDGLRVFSILWVILGHRFSISTTLPFVNADYPDEWMLHTYTQYAQGAAAAVDSFMFLTGLLMAMSFIRTQSKPKAKFNVILYYVHRYLRLTPALAVVYFLHVSVFVHMGSGPYWNFFTQRTRTNCLNRWASFFFYYQNYLDHNNMCLLHTWYLSMDMQIFIISPFVLMPLAKARNVMMKYGMPLLILLSIICPFVITYVYETQIFTDDYYWYYYYPTHTRLSSWLVGVYAGALIHTYKDAELTIRPLLNIFLWACVVVGMVACVFCGNYITYNYNRLATSFYLSLHRPAWCAGLAWVVFACMKGRGGLFNYVLSADLFQTLSKITYSMYLIHATCLLLSVAAIRYPGNFGDQETIHLFLGDMLTTMTLAFVWCLLFESPIVTVEKIIFGGVGRKKRPPKPVETKKPESDDLEIKVDNNELPETKNDVTFEAGPKIANENSQSPLDHTNGPISTSEVQVENAKL